MKFSSVTTLLGCSVAFLCFCAPVHAQCPRPDNGAIVANPNRPTVANPADITQHGVLEVEYGYDRVNLGSSREYNLGGLLKFAVMCNLEFRWDMGTLVNHRDHGLSQTGTGDNALGFQYRFHRQGHRSPTMAFAYALKFPTASESQGLGSGRYDHQARLLVSKDLLGVHFDFNASLNIIGRPGRGSYDRNAEFNLAFSHPVYKNLLFTGEFYGDTKLNPDSPAFASGLWALTYAITPRLIIDSGMDHGLTAGDPNKRRYFVGFTYAIADLYAKRQ